MITNKIHICELILTAFVFIMFHFYKVCLQLSRSLFYFGWGVNSHTANNSFFPASVYTHLRCLNFFNCYLYSRSQVNRSLLIVFIDWRKHCLHDLIMTEWKIYCVYKCHLKGNMERKILFLVDDNPVINLTELRRKTTITIGNYKF